jgi:hypothetical protein
VLLEHGNADPDLIDHSRDTALHHAVLYRSAPVDFIRDIGPWPLPRNRASKCSAFLRPPHRIAAGRAQRA